MSDRTFARLLRREQTEAERRFWSRVRAHRLHGFHFRRQHPLGPYFVDFVCLAESLVVEIDGGQHNEEPARAYDERRTSYLLGRGFRVLRFWNNDVLRDIDAVLEVVLHDLLAHVRATSTNREEPRPKGSFANDA